MFQASREHSTSNSPRPTASPSTFLWMFYVECWLLNVPTGSPREGEEIALHAGGVFGLLQFDVDLFQVTAHAGQHPAGAHRLEIFITDVVLAAGEVFDAVIAGEEFSEVEAININFVRGGHEAADRVTGQTHTGYGEAEAAHEQYIYEAEADGIAGAAIQHGVDEAVVRVVIIFHVPGEAEFAEDEFIHADEQAFFRIARGEPFPEFARHVIEQCAVSCGVDFRVLCLSEEQRAFFEIKLRFVLKAVSHEARVSGLAVEMLNDVFGVFTKCGVAAELAGLEPYLCVAAEGDELLFYGLIDHRVFVAEQLDERGDLGFREFGVLFFGGLGERRRLHILCALTRPHKGEANNSGRGGNVTR